MIKIPYLTALSTYFSYGLLFVFGHFRDFFRKILDCFHPSNLQVLLFFIYFFIKLLLPLVYFVFGIIQLSMLQFCALMIRFLFKSGLRTDLSRTRRLLHSSIISSNSGTLIDSFIYFKSMVFFIRIKIDLFIYQRKNKFFQYSFFYVTKDQFDLVTLVFCYFHVF